MKNIGLKRESVLCYFPGISEKIRNSFGNKLHPLSNFRHPGQLLAVNGSPVSGWCLSFSLERCINPPFLLCYKPSILPRVSVELPQGPKRQLYPETYNWELFVE